MPQQRENDCNKILKWIKPIHFNINKHLLKKNTVNKKCPAIKSIFFKAELLNEKPKMHKNICKRCYGTKLLISEVQIAAFSNEEPMQYKITCKMCHYTTYSSTCFI